MKKLFLICTLLLGGMAISTLPVAATESTISSGRELPEDATPITVYTLTNVGRNVPAARAVSAYYSSSENCIYVNEGRRKNQPYTISENRAYGQADDYRAEYKYRAGDYYFNL